MAGLTPRIRRVSVARHEQRRHPRRRHGYRPPKRELRCASHRPGGSDPGHDRPHRGRRKFRHGSQCDRQLERRVGVLWTRAGGLADLPQHEPAPRRLAEPVRASDEPAVDRAREHGRLVLRPRLRGGQAVRDEHRPVPSGSGSVPGHHDLVAIPRRRQRHSVLHGLADGRQRRGLRDLLHTQRRQPVRPRREHGRHDLEHRRVRLQREDPARLRGRHGLR